MSTQPRDQENRHSQEVSLSGPSDYDISLGQNCNTTCRRLSISKCLMAPRKGSCEAVSHNTLLIDPRTDLSRLDTEGDYEVEERVLFLKEVIDCLLCATTGRHDAPCHTGAVSSRHRDKAYAHFLGLGFYCCGLILTHLLRIPASL